jgi:hypothetical protein
MSTAGRSNSRSHWRTVLWLGQLSCRDRARRTWREVLVAHGWRHACAEIWRIQVKACSRFGLGEVHSRGRLLVEKRIRSEFSGASHRHGLFERTGDVRRYGRGRRAIQTARDTGRQPRRSTMGSAHGGGVGVQVHGRIRWLALPELVTDRGVVSRARHSRVASMIKEPSWRLCSDTRKLFRRERQ